MKKLNLLVLIFLASVPAFAEELLSPVSLEEETLRIAADPRKKFQPIIELENPGITLPIYAIKGRIRYESVEGEGYLQMDSHFGDRGTFFSKSLANAGPLKSLAGDSEWREFVLPFYANTGDQMGGAVVLPQKLSLGLYLPGTGTVYLRDVGLYQYADGEDPLHAEGQWWSDRSAGFVGGITSALLGLWGAAVGVLASRGKARAFVIGSANAMIVVGIVCAVTGLVALVDGQPYAVYYPLLLIGALLILVVGGLRKSLPQRYEAVELKKMRAMDA